MNIKLDNNDNSLKQLEYFSMANWKKLETLRIYAQEKIIDISNIEDKFDFPFLR